MWSALRAALVALAVLFPGGTNPSQAQQIDARVIAATMDHAMRLAAGFRPTDIRPDQIAGLAFASAERACLALAIYQEARGEPLQGQRLVAHTILNRVLSRAYPNTICGVVYHNAARLNRCQFSFACDLICDTPKNPRATTVALIVANEAIEETASASNPLPEAWNLVTHYHRFDVSPVWSRNLIALGKVGDHVFFASERVIRKMAGGMKKLDLFKSVMPGNTEPVTVPVDAPVRVAMLDGQMFSQFPLSPAR